MPETRRGYRLGSFLASAYLPVAVAVLLILAAGLFADRQARQNARENQHAEAHYRADTLAASLERALRVQTRTLAEIGFAFVGQSGMASGMARSDFDAVAGKLTAGPGAIRAVAVAPAGRAPLIHGKTPAFAAELATIPADAPPDRAGSRALPGAEARALLWIPLRAPLADGGAQTLGRASAVIALDALVAGADLRGTGLDLALTGAPEAKSAEPTLYLGNAAILDADPVFANVPLPEGEWRLAAVPAGGWQSETADVWPIWLLTLVAIGLTVGLTRRARRLIDERRRNTDALRDRETQLQRLSRRLGLALDASKVGVWDYHIDTDTLIWDDRMDELYALPADGLDRTYLDWRRALHPDDLERAEAEFDAAIRVTGRYYSDYRLRLPDGAIRHIRAIGAVYREMDGSSKIVGVNWDVTADVRRNAELDAKRREAEAASIAKSQFLATMSHEIRTPMNGVLGMLDLLLRTNLDPLQHERARIACTSARQLLAILNDVLDFSKLEADRITLNRADVDVEQLARDVVALMSATAEERRLRLTVQVAPQVPRLLVCDPMRLRQVLINLVGNAVKFTEFGTVEVSLDYVPGARPELRVAVRDTGVGISEAAKSSLFQRFAQVNSSTTRERGGTGLGLAICKQLVELMGGEISVESVQDLGSTFRFSIPVEPAATDPIPVVRSDPTPVSPSRKAPVRILVAEDNPTNQQVLAAYLALEGHQARIVANGAEALAEVQSGDFDLMIMDIQMPRMDGITATRRIRALDGPCSGIPIIALTANALEGDRETYFAAGMTDYVTKPVSFEALSFAIDRAITRYSGAASDTGDQPVPGSKLSMAPATVRVSSPRSAS